MHHPDLHEAAEMLLDEVQHWPGTADGNVMTVLTPVSGPDADFEVQVVYYPLRWRHHPDGEKVSVDLRVSIEGDEWDARAREEVRERFREALESLDRQYETISARQSGEGS
jgi:hypothetical protein